MASKRHIRRKQCGDKIKYKTAEKAWNSAHQKTRKTGEKYVAYKCKWCSTKQQKYYHIGHESKERQGRITSL